jgi:hypothetical protein
VFFEDRLQAGRYLTLSIFAFLVFEYFFTFDHEVRYIWQSKPFFAWTKILFLIVRYLPLLTSFVRLYIILNPIITPWVCVGGITFTGITGILSSTAVEVVLMLRVWALYNRNRVVFAFFFIITVVGTAGAILILQLKPSPDRLPEFIRPIAYYIAPPSLTTCAHGNPIQHPLLFTILASIELAIFLMLVKKAAFAVVGPKRAAPIVAALVKDGAVYFFFVFLCLVLASVAPFIPYLAQPIMDSEFTVNVSAAACVRLIFSLRGAQLDEQESEEEQRRPSVSVTASIPLRRRSRSRSFRRADDDEEEDVSDEFLARKEGLGRSLDGRLPLPPGIPSSPGRTRRGPLVGDMNV